ncbi:proteasome subunit beta type-7-like [Daphnia pulex]|uniref:Proteasome subunit beta n=1 Tax=Daphnia pulex TaxID=6669 RepID=E9GG96_DAPPU|nr:proteasome subunit beta type-7-like [Daphnia pulex]EFX81362.1 hypothetical protein DAPPUDRAFT_303409 [Daphnia pulex]|eukprot:EFX81362.1 hypothetical protein DAPPUDRAFT_303409 [Daphnia pulex]
MASTKVVNIPKGGFSFENCQRNNFMSNQGFPAPKAVKTGTTIAGFIFKDGVILGADTRATEGNIVADKNCFKLHYMAPNIYCAGAGTAADLEMTTLQMSSQLELHRLNTGRQVKVATANRLLKQMLFRYQGHIGAALVLGGIDSSGPHVCCIYPHGSTDSLPFVAMGSGSLAAMAFLESGWKPDMELAEAKVLMRNAICGGIFNDLMSGSHVDLCIITREKAEMIRPFEVANVKGERQGSYRYPRGCTATLSTRVIPIEIESTVVRPVGEESMDTA